VGILPEAQHGCSINLLSKCDNKKIIFFAFVKFRSAYNLQGNWSLFLSITSASHKLSAPPNTEIELRVCTYNILKNDFILLVILLPKHNTKLIEEKTGISPTTEAHYCSDLHLLYDLFLFLKHCVQDTRLSSFFLEDALIFSLLLL
jgi:hypothetical protein